MPELAATVRESSLRSVVLGRAPSAQLVVAWLTFSMFSCALTATAQAPSAEAQRRAATHFDRGLGLFEEGRYDAALAEFNRAHELAPAHQTLYNLGRVHAARGDAVRAAETFARYLEEAGEVIGARRRRAVEAELEVQRGRVGSVRVTVNVPDAVIGVDGVDVARSPMTSSVPLTAGTHLLEVRAADHESVRREFDLAGGDALVLDVELRSTDRRRGTLRVESDLPEVGVEIDGQEVGRTPLTATFPLPIGIHRVRASRPGYETDERAVQIEDGAEVAVRFELRRLERAPAAVLGRLALHLPDAQHLLRVDGELMTGPVLELPIGSHRVEIAMTERLPYEGEVVIPAEDVVELAPPLRWTLEARRDRLDAAARDRTLGQVLVAGGSGAFAGGLVIGVWNETEVARTDSRLREINAELEVCRAEGFTTRCAMLETEGEGLAAMQAEQDALRGLSIGLAVLGAGLGAAGLILWASAPSDEEIDAAARASLELRPGSLVLRGAF